MLQDLRLVLGTIARLFCTRHSLLLENLALRQQLAVFKRRHPRPKLNLLDKLFWFAARQIWSYWKRSLVIVLPDIVVQWHRADSNCTGASCPNLGAHGVADSGSRRIFAI
jgi:hypothetical protein